MRRPTPLPAPESKAEPDASERESDRGRQTAPPVRRVDPPRARDAAPAPTDATAGDLAASDEGATAPLMPLWVPTGDRGEPTAVPTAPVPDAEGAAPNDGVGVRDVWSAARARRRALRAEVRRFTARQRRRRITWAIVGGAMILLVLGTLGAAYSPLFAVEEISVVGTTTLDPAAVASALDGQIGTPLPLVDSSAVKAALVKFPLVESYSLEARPPHELVVRIVERTPIGSIQTGAGYALVDAAGVILSTTPQPIPGHPALTVEGGLSSPAFRAVGTVFRSLPDDIRAQVSAMSATSPNDVTLTLGATGTTVVWGNADDSMLKAKNLASIMAARPPSGASSYDVSSPSAIVVR